MFSVRAGQTVVILTALAITPAFASRTHRAPTSGHSHSGHKGKRPAKILGQRGIDSSRATQIQTALIRENYLTGAPTGQWDAQTEAAMRKYQADHHWQSKITPDSRALISLGLGPEHPASTVAVAPAARPAQPAASLPSATDNNRPAPNTLAAIHANSD